jgi:HPt (histidine-containing phosphotransfer) domain-containing protein
VKQAHYHLGAKLLSYPEPLDAATSARLEAEAISDYLRDLRLELDDLEKAYRTPVLDKLTANFFSANRRRMSDREFEQRRELLTLIVPYRTLTEMIAEARRELDAGKISSTIGEIRTAVRAITLLRLKWSDHSLEKHLAAQRPRPMSSKKWADLAQGQQAVVDRLSSSQYLEEPDGSRLLVWGKLEDRHVQIKIQTVAAKKCGVTLKTIQANTVIPKIVQKLER